MIYDSPVHEAFSLTYANYLVIPRSLLQSMPRKWQSRFVRLVEELHEHFGPECMAAGYRVHAIDLRGRYVTDPAPHYNRGRTFVPPTKKEA